MSTLIDKKTSVLIQGITGHEGMRAAKEMMAFGTRVVAGVTPGKGGKKVDGVSVYNTVSEAMRAHKNINATLIAVPARFVKDAALEAIFARIPLINILSENVPTRDTATIIAWARAKSVVVVGPSSVGIIVPRVAKIGSIGSGSTRHVFTPGPIAVVSKSGGMTSEIALTLTKNGIGQRIVVGIGGDQLIGFDFVDALRLFSKDEKTKAIVLFGEVGGTYEEQVAEFIRMGGFKKPVIAIVAGRFTSELPQGTVLGHAGAIVSLGRGGYVSKVKALKKAGVIIAESLDEIPHLLRRALRGKIRV